MKLKFYVVTLFFLFSLSGKSQELKSQVEELQKQIESSEPTTRLSLMDSLSRLTEFNSDLGYETIAKNTLDFALEIDSLSIASRQLSKLIYYYGAYEDNYSNVYSIFKTYEDNVLKMNNKDRSLVYLELGDAYKYDQKNENALTYLDSAFIYAKEANLPMVQANSKLYEAQIKTGEGDYIDAFEAGKQAQVNFQIAKDTTKIISTKILLGVLYSQQEFFEEAEVLFKEGVVLAEATENHTSLMVLYNNLSRDFKERDDFVQSVKYGKLALLASEKSRRGKFLKVNLLSQLVKKYCDSDSLNKAKYYFDKIKAIGPLENMHPRDKIQAKEAFGYYYYKIGDYNKSLDLWLSYNDEFGKQLGAENKLDYNKFLSDLHGKLGDSEKQAFHLKNYLQISDSINSAKKRKILTYYQSKYESEKKEHVISSQQKDLQILEKKDEIKNQWIVFGSIGLLGLFGLVLLFKSRNNYKEKQRAQAEFSKKLLRAQENERTRVAKDLHDSVGQKLSMILRKANNNNQDELAQMSSETLDEVRSISRALYPPMLENLGLTKSISHLLLEIDEETDMFVSTEINDIDDFFNPEDTVNFYRFIQESVSNVLKHANAKTLMVKISLKGNQLDAIIKDNGSGFESSEDVQNSLGLKTMKERIRLLKGKFSINSKEEKGTIITAKIVK